MRSKRLSFLAGWLAVGLLAVAGFAAFGNPGPSSEQVRLEAAALSMGHTAGAFAGLGFAQLGTPGAETVSLTTGEAETDSEADTSGEAPTGTNDQPKVASGTIAAPGSGWLSEVEVRALVSLYFESTDINRAVRVAWCESRFDPKATDLRTGGVGVFKHLPRYWDDRVAKAGFKGADPTDPEASIAAAAWAVYHDGGWDTFACRG